MKTTGLFGVSEDVLANFRKDGQGQFSPVISSDEELFEAAMIAADIIENTGRRTLNFMEFIEDKDNFIPDCARDDIDMDILEKSESNSEHVGGMKKHEVLSLLESKVHCNECPIKNECLAVSLTQPQTSANRRTEPRLPKKPGSDQSVALVMSEYLLFGGYTPQERRIIFTYVCDILEEFDKQTIQSQE